MTKDQPPDSQKQFSRKQYLIKKMAKTPIKSMGFQQPPPSVSQNPNNSLKTSFVKDPLALSKSNLFPNSFKPAHNNKVESSLKTRYASKNGSIVGLGTTGVENEDEMVNVIEEEIFLENSLQSTKALMNYDCWDEDCEPEEWVRRVKGLEPPHAKSPIYINKRYLWAGVEIIGWNKEISKFLVKILLNGSEKYVSRLSLMFLTEDHNKFMERVQVCKQRQQRAEDEIRFFKYVESKNDQLVSSLDNETYKNILMKTRKKKEEENQIIGRLINSLMEQVQMEYKLFMKKVVVLKEMQDPENLEKFKNLRIKLRYIKGEIPFFGTIAKFDFPKKEILETVIIIFMIKYYENLFYFHVFY